MFNNWRICIWKKNASLNLIISHQPDNDIIYLYCEDPCEAKYELLINKLEAAGLKHCNDSKVFTKYSNNMEVIYEKIEEHFPNKKRKILIVLDISTNKNIILEVEK